MLRQETFYRMYRLDNGVPFPVNSWIWRRYLMFYVRIISKPVAATSNVADGIKNSTLSNYRYEFSEKSQ